MLPIIFGQEKKQMPTSWHDITVRQYYEIVKWREDIRRGSPPNMVRLYAILLNVPYHIMKKVEVHSIKHVIEINIDWLQEPVPQIKKPRKVTIDQKEITVPKDIEQIEFGQFIAVETELRNVVRAKGKEFQRMSAVLSIFLYNQLSDDQFTINRSKKIRPLINDMKFIEAYSLELFFWNRFKKLKQGKRDGFLTRKISTPLKLALRNLRNSVILQRLTH